MLSGDAELSLHLFKRDSFSLGIKEENNKKLKPHHESKEHEGIPARRCGQQWEDSGNERVHKPVRETSKTLPFGPHSIWEDFTEEDPDNGALRKRKKRDVTYQQPDQVILMASHKEYCCNSAETCCGAHRADQKQCLASDSINDRHGEHGKYQVRGADGHGLKVGRNLVKTRIREDIV